MNDSTLRTDHGRQLDSAFEAAQRAREANFRTYRSGRPALTAPAMPAMHVALRLTHALAEVLQRELGLSDEAVGSMLTGESLSIELSDRHLELQVLQHDGPTLSWDWGTEALSKLYRPHPDTAVPIFEGPLFTPRRETSQERVQRNFDDPDRRAAGRMYQTQAHVLSPVHTPSWAREGAPAFTSNQLEQAKLANLMQHVEAWAREHRSQAAAEYVHKFTSRVDNPSAFYEIDKHLSAWIQKLTRHPEEPAGGATSALLREHGATQLAEHYIAWISNKLCQDYPQIVARVQLFLISLAAGDLPGEERLPLQENAQQERETRRQLWSNFFVLDSSAENSDFDYFLREILRDVNLPERATMINKLRTASDAGRELISVLQSVCLTTGVRLPLVLSYLTRSDLYFQDQRDDFWGDHPLPDNRETTISALDTAFSKAFVNNFGAIASAWVREAQTQQESQVRLENLTMVAQGLLHGSFPGQRVPLVGNVEELAQEYLQAERDHLRAVLHPEQLFESPAAGLDQLVHPLSGNRPQGTDQSTESTHT